MADYAFLKGEFVAAAALDRGVLVALDGSGTIVAADSDSATASITKAIGALSQPVAIGDPCYIYGNGRVPVLAGGTIAIGDLVKAEADGSGHALAAAPDMTTGAAEVRCVGVALANAADGDTVLVDWAPSFILE
jgi:hypothetical protein